MLVFGTRPEAIKMCPLVKEFQKYPEEFETLVCVTGQHREMLDQVLQIFGVKPDFDLNIMKQGQDLYDVTSRVLVGMRDVLDEARPDVVLVHGDTTTSMAAAMAAFYRQIPVGHVEAGLRTHNIYSPWPEEMNRQITGRIATYDFAPTPLSRQNLLDEGVDPEKITVTGNTVIDALHWVVENVIKQGYVPQDPSVAALLQDDTHGHSERSEESRRLVLITGHRRENFGEGFISMCTAIRDLALKYPDVDFVYPMHLNPNVRKPIREVFGEMADQVGHDGRVIPGLTGNLSGSHRFRRHPRGSAGAWKAGPRDAGHDRTAGGVGGRNCASGRYGLPSDYGRSFRPDGRSGALSSDEPSREPLRGWQSLPPDCGEIQIKCLILQIEYLIK